MKNEINFQHEYEENFPQNNKENEQHSIRHEALKQALDIRKFEIEMYWKRATYFWGFLIVTFAGYFTVYASKIPEEDKLPILFVLSCLGFSFSYSWFLVNKGSKFWQNNWERHVDMLEDDIMGPLYKTVLVEKDNTKRLSYITSSANYSVSKVNQILSFYFVVMWSVFVFLNLFSNINRYIVSEFKVIISLPSAITKFPYELLIFSILTVVFLVVMTRIGKSDNFSSETETHGAHFKKREKKLKKSIKKIY